MNEAEALEDILQRLIAIDTKISLGHTAEAQASVRNLIQDIKEDTYTS